MLVVPKWHKKLPHPLTRRWKDPLLWALTMKWYLLRNNQCIHSIEPLINIPVLIRCFCSNPFVSFHDSFFYVLNLFCFILTMATYDVLHHLTTVVIFTVLFCFWVFVFNLVSFNFTPLPPFPFLFYFWVVSLVLPLPDPSKPEQHEACCPLGKSLLRSTSKFTFRHRIKKNTQIFLRLVTFKHHF